MISMTELVAEGGMTMGPWDPVGRPVAPRDEDRRLWWQKLADGIGEALAGILQFLIEGWKAWNWRSRWFWGSKDDL
jgi:hypothetical protein